jgi:superfamily II DNA or RNA helicase
MYINYLDALAGAGKTHALARHADRLARQGRKVLFIQPTKHLIDKTIQDELLPLDPPYPLRAIHSDADLVSDSVVGSLVAHFQKTGVGGEVLFATHAAFFRLSYIERKRDWTLIVDEVPQVDVFDERSLPDTHHLITSFLDLEPVGPSYGRLLIKGGDQ